MSVNLHLGVIVREYRTDRVDAIRKSVQAVLEKEDLASDLAPLAESQDGSGPLLSTRTDPQRPVIITGAYEWAMRIEPALRDAVTLANGTPCRVRFEWDDADEGRVDPDNEGE